MSTMDDRTKKSFDFASDLTKQVITLSSGIIAFTVTFNRDFVKPESTPKTAIWVLTFAWMSYLISIIAGVVTLMGLTGQLQPVGMEDAEAGAEAQHTPRITASTVRFCSAAQLLAFLAATIFVIAFGLIIVWNK
jgi:hypothetical protein